MSAPWSVPVVGLLVCQLIGWSFGLIFDLALLCLVFAMSVGFLVGQSVGLSMNLMVKGLCDTVMLLVCVYVRASVCVSSKHVIFFFIYNHI